MVVYVNKRPIQKAIIEIILMKSPNFEDVMDVVAEGMGVVLPTHDLINLEGIVAA